jgi:hypothetical protein
LGTLKGIGSFFAWQVFCDLRESNCLKSLESDTFCILGPGAVKGLDCILGRGNNDISSLEEAHNLVGCQDLAFQELGMEFPFWQGQKLTIKEIEHALCEYSKYDSLKATSKSGRLYRTRSKMDTDKPCLVCKENKDEGNFCDTCFDFHCIECAPPKKPTLPYTSASWLCQRCIDFRGKPFVEEPPPKPKEEQQHAGSSSSEVKNNDAMDVDKPETAASALEEPGAVVPPTAAVEEPANSDAMDVDKPETVVEEQPTKDGDDNNGDKTKASASEALAIPAKPDVVPAQDPQGEGTTDADALVTSSDGDGKPSDTNGDKTMAFALKALVIPAKLDVVPAQDPQGQGTNDADAVMASLMASSDRAAMAAAPMGMPAAMATAPMGMPAAMAAAPMGMPAAMAANPMGMPAAMAAAPMGMPDGKPSNIYESPKPTNQWQ